MLRYAGIVCAAIALSWPSSAQSHEYATYIDEVVDPARNRLIPYRIFYPTDSTGPAAVIIVSHGGNGNTIGHLLFDHLGAEYASNGYLSVHINHRPSPFGVRHVVDRPADVTHVLDRIEAGTLPLPADFAGEPDVTRAGIIGHSFGAYTAHAVAGTEFRHGIYRDNRIDAICALSPQGADQFGAFDNGPENNSWRNVTLPSYNLVGGEEVDTNVLGTIQEDGWRLTPFQNYPEKDDKYLTVIPGQDHFDMGDRGPPEVKTYIAQNSRLFFDVYVNGTRDNVCDIGSLAPIPGAGVTRKFDESSLLNDCSAQDSPRTEDINTDGAVNAVDIQLVINAALGLPAGFPSNVDGVGGTDAIDVQLVINAALAVPTTVPPFA